MDNQILNIIYKYLQIVVQKIQKKGRTRLAKNFKYDIEIISTSFVEFLSISKTP